MIFLIRIDFSKFIILALFFGSHINPDLYINSDGTLSEYTLMFT